MYSILTDIYAKVIFVLSFIAVLFNYILWKVNSVMITEFTIVITES